MKTEQPILITSIKAPADLLKNLFIGFNGALCGNGAKALGVCNADTTKDEMTPVMSVGIALVISGNAVTLGDPIQSDANGKAIPFASGSLNGYAMDTATGANELIRIKLV